MAMPFVVSAIVGGLVSALISGIIWLAKKLLVAFGVGLVAYEGVKPFINYLTNEVIRLITATDPYNVAGWLGVMRFDECVSVVLSSLTFALTVKIYDRVAFKWKMSNLKLG